MAEYYIRITQKKRPVRIVGPSVVKLYELMDKFRYKAEEHNLDIDDRVYTCSASFTRDAAEERAAVRLLKLIL